MSAYLRFDFKIVFNRGKKNASKTAISNVEKQLVLGKILPAYDTPPLSTLFSSMSEMPWSTPCSSSVFSWGNVFFSLDGSLFGLTFYLFLNCLRKLVYSYKLGLFFARMSHSAGHKKIAACLACSASCLQAICSDTNPLIHFSILEQQASF